MQVRVFGCSPGHGETVTRSWRNGYQVWETQLRGLGETWQPDQGRWLPGHGETVSRSGKHGYQVMERPFQLGLGETGTRSGRDGYQVMERRLPGLGEAVTRSGRDGYQVWRDGYQVWSPPDQCLLPVPAPMGADGCHLHRSAAAETLLSTGRGHRHAPGRGLPPPVPYGKPPSPLLHPYPQPVASSTLLHPYPQPGASVTPPPPVPSAWSLVTPPPPLYIEEESRALFQAAGFPGEPDMLSQKILV